MIRRSFFIFTQEPLHFKTIIRLNRGPIAAFQVVKDMKKYPEFLEWIKDSTVKTFNQDYSECTMTIGYHPFHLSYTSKVSHKYPKIISVQADNSIFEVLKSEWTFQPCPEEFKTTKSIDELTKCNAVYSVMIKYSSPVYQQFTQILWSKICNESAKAFRDRINSVPVLDSAYHSALKMADKQ